MDETTNTPETDAPQELQFRLRVDETHCERASQGLRLMARYHYLSLVRRYETSADPRRAHRRAYPFQEMLLMAMYATTCDADDWVHVADVGSDWPMRLDFATELCRFERAAADSVRHSVVAGRLSRPWITSRMDLISPCS